MCFLPPRVRAGGDDSSGAGPIGSCVHGYLGMALWDEARSGAKNKDEDEGLPVSNAAMRGGERKTVTQGFVGFML